MAVKDEKKELWVDWTRDAMAAYTEPDDIKSVDDLLEDMVEFTTAYADAMLEEFAHRFESGTARKRKGKGRSRKVVDLDDDDENDED